MAVQQKVLVVIDPTRNTQPAFEHVLRVAGLLKDKDTAKGNHEVEIHEVEILVAANPANSDFFGNTSELCMDGLFVKDLSDQLTAVDFKHSITICWTKSWSDSVISFIKEKHITMAVLPYLNSKNGKVLSDERWKLLRQVSCPVLLVRKDRANFNGPLLVAIKSQDSKYDEHTESIVERAKGVASMYKQQLHVVNAYTDSMDHPDRARIARLAGIDNEFIHVRQGEPENVIHDVADSIGAQGVLITNQRRKGLKSLMRGNTAEGIISKLDCNILMV